MSKVTVRGYEKYTISLDGKVFNSKKELKLGTYNGYFGLTLVQGGKKRTLYVHRLMAQTFLENPNNHRYVNHKDGNKKNNNLRNLEWCTQSENSQHAYDTGLSVSRGIPILQYTLDGEFIREYKSVVEASKILKIPTSLIQSQVNNNHKPRKCKFIFTRKSTIPKINIHEESFVDIKGFEGQYKISPSGAVYSVFYKIQLNPGISSSGYYTLNLRGSTIQVHRLVAIQFISKGDETYNIVNHIDGNKLNNAIDNLEWCSPSQNMLHAIHTGLNPLRKRVQQIQNDIVLKVFDSLEEASIATGIQGCNICRVCKGSRRSAGGYEWKYA
jgi:HNH endonuclease/NUMOD1 domain/NUMOD4 motif